MGEESLARYLAATQPATAISTTDDYLLLAEKAMAGDPAGSSAAGEQPKFMALIEREAAPLQVLVKFSPPVTTAEGGRWSDLLMCEHLRSVCCVKRALLRHAAGCCKREVGRFLRLNGSTGQAGSGGMPCTVWA